MRDQIYARLLMDIEQPGCLVVTPIPNAKSFDIDALDLRLGSYFLLPKLSSHPYYCPGEKASSSFHTRVYVPLGDFLVVPAHETVLGATLEFIKLQYDVSGQILTKSSVARTFTVIETAPWIHPNYRGCLTLEIAKVSNTPIIIYPGRRIGQLILLEVSPKPESEEVIHGTYFGPVYPEPPSFPTPEEELRALGVTKVRLVRGDPPSHNPCKK